MVIGSTLCAVPVGFSNLGSGIGEKALQTFSEVCLIRFRTDIRTMVLTIVGMFKPRAFSGVFWTVLQHAVTEVQVYRS